MILFVAIENKDNHIETVTMNGSSYKTTLDRKQSLSQELPSSTELST